MCKEGFRKVKKSQAICLQLYTSACTCALATNQVKTELGPPPPQGQSSELIMACISRVQLQNLIPGLLPGEDLSLLMFQSSGG